LNLVSLTFTLATLLFMMLAFGMIVSGPMALQAMGLRGRLAPGSFGLLRWPFLFAGSMLTEAMLYRFGPCRLRPPWRFVAPGCAFATALWLAVSMGFTWYVTHFAHFERTYGSLGAVIAFMIWLWLSAIAVLAGAELNAEIEIQVRHRRG
jgi:membrane protein